MDRQESTPSGTWSRPLQSFFSRIRSGIKESLSDCNLIRPVDLINNPDWANTGIRSWCRPDSQGWRFIDALPNTIEFKYRIPITFWILNRMINRILVATDASAASNRALKMAVQIAGQYNAEIFIIHVIRDMQLPYEIKEISELESGQFESFNNAREEIMRKVAESVLRAAKEKAEKSGASKVETVIGTGDPATSILSLAKRRKMDMIVIGTRGLGKLKGTILGSVSRKVTNNAETSCLIVR